MKNSLLLYIISLTFCSIINVTENPSKENHCINQTLSAITWEPNGGRFGDNLDSYARAKWLSYKFNIDLLYLPFKYSDCLVLHQQEKVYSHESAQSFSSIKHVSTEDDLRCTHNILHINNWYSKIKINWNDPVFIETLKKNIAPINPIEKVIIPEDCISIAVHIRTGGGFAADTQQERERCPLRFISEEFFIEQIKYIAEQFSEENLYVHIFTDHQNPSTLKKKFKNALNNNPRITIVCRSKGNRHNAHVLEDFFSMMDFDCLIRPESHFSRFVERLGNNKLVIYPKRIQRTPEGVVVDLVHIKSREGVGSKWKTRKINIK